MMTTKDQLRIGVDAVVSATSSGKENDELWDGSLSRVTKCLKYCGNVQPVEHRPTWITLLINAY